jgi:hypothetical protein
MNVPCSVVTVLKYDAVRPIGERKVKLDGFFS